MTEPLHQFTPEELARYSRQLILPGMGVEGQAKLRAARVLLIGLGGLGSPAALYLAAAGVGTLGLAEPDAVELNNLHRQVLHDTGGVGSPKLASARERLAALNPHVSLRAHPEGLTAAGAPALFAGYDLILDGADNFPTRYLASDAAARARRPLVHGSIFQFEGQVTVLDPAAGGPCYRCLFPEMPEPGAVPNCAEAGVFGALCGVIGSQMAMEALKLLLGVGEPLRGRLLVFDALGGVPRVVRLKRDPQCPCCGPQPDPRIAALDATLYQWSCDPAPAPRRRGGNTNERFLRDLHSLKDTKFQPAPVRLPARPDAPPPPEPDLLPLLANPEQPPLEIGAGTARAWLRSPAPPLVLDVREPFEVAICRLDNSLAIPVGQLPARLADLPRDRPLLLYCHHGGRSLQAAKFLRAKGFGRAVNLRGGIHDWAEQFDPAMPRY